MPGPGGGSSGGGFGGGSFGGGGGFSGGGRGFGGGSFGGAHHTPPPHRPHHGPHFHGPFFGGWGWGRRRYGGGGCITGVVIGLFVLFFAVSIFVPEGTVYNGEDPLYAVTENYGVYDEGEMQDYANEKYKEHFADYDNYENNILLVFLTNEECDGYYTIAWVGDNINREINEMFGEYSEYGKALTDNINQSYYAYSLDTELAQVIREMTQSITSLGLDSSFNTDGAEYEMPASKLDNATQLEMNSVPVDDALAEFTEKTGIPCVIAVDSVEKVFGTASDDGYYSFDGYDGAPVSEVPVSALEGSSSDIGIIGGADGPTQINVGSNVSVVLAIVLALVVIVAVGLFLRLKKGNRFTEEVKEEKSKGSSAGKDEKPPWEL